MRLEEKITNLYRKGRIHEGKVARDLKRKKFTNIRKSTGSRGPADIYAKKKGCKYYFQVKSGTAKVGPEGINRLRELAEKRKGVAVVVHRKNGKNKWRFYGNWCK